MAFPALVFQQFELDIEPKVFLKPSRVSSTELPHNDSQEFSFSDAATKGMQPLRETVSEFEMLARAGNHTFTATCAPPSSHHHPPPHTSHPGSLGHLHSDLKCLPGDNAVSTNSRATASSALGLGGGWVRKFARPRGFRSTTGEQSSWPGRFLWYLR